MTDEPGITPIDPDMEQMEPADPLRGPEIDADDMVPTRDDPEGEAHPS